MKFLVNFLFFTCFISSFGQTSDTIDIKYEIYKRIITDIHEKNIDYKNKKLYLDDKIGKFNHVDFFNLNIVLTNPDYVRDKKICEFLNNVECVDQYQIDNYRLFKVFNNHVDVEYPDFYGIYAPLDSWFQLIYQVTFNNFEKNKKISSEVIIPVKNVFFKGEEIINKTYFYKFKIDEQFKISDYELINF